MDDSTVTTTLPVESSSTTSSTLRRRNSIATSVVLPKQLSLPATPRQRSSFHAPPNDITQTPPSSSLLDLELVSLKSSSSVPSYTSLRDLLPSASTTTLLFNSPSLTIRNRLVKQAAWAYLQPMSASPATPSGPCFLRHFSPCLRFFCHHLIPGITRILDRILRVFRGHVTSVE